MGKWIPKYKEEMKEKKIENDWNRIKPTANLYHLKKKKRNKKNNNIEDRRKRIRNLYDKRKKKC